MTHPDLPEITEEDTLEALRRLGMEPCQDHAPADPDERASGHLGAIMAMAQAHIVTRSRHKETIAETYHNTRAQFHPQPDCDCGEDHG